MIYLRVFISCLFILSGIWGVYDDVILAIDARLPEAFNLYGVINTVSAWVVLSIGIFALLYTIKEAVRIKANFLNSYKIIIVCVILGGTLGLITNNKIHSNIERQGYVNCSDLTKVATRYTRKAYAKTPEICARLVAEK